jgi:hypothetical protein
MVSLWMQDAVKDMQKHAIPHVEFAMLERKSVPEI